MTSLMNCPHCSRQQQFDFDWIPLRPTEGIVRIFAYGKCGHAFRQDFQCEGAGDDELSTLIFDIRSVSPFGSVARASTRLRNLTTISHDLDLCGPCVESEYLDSTEEDEEPECVAAPLKDIKMPFNGPRH